MPARELIPGDLRALSDHALLAGGLEDEVRLNALAARRLARLEDFRSRREADYQARRAGDQHFTLTPLQETVIEAGELWGLSEGRVRADLRCARTLLQHFPGIWEMCLSGALDTFKAGLVAEAASFALDRPAEFAAFAGRITDSPRQSLIPIRAGLGW